MSTLRLAPILLFATLAVAVSMPVPAGAAGRLPTLEAKNLSGEVVVLPAELRASVTLLIVAFERDQSDVIDTWRAAAARLRVDRPALEYFGMPVLPRGLFWLRGPISSQLQERYPTEAERSRTLLAFTNPTSLREALELGTGTAVRAVLLDRTGGVLWSASGGADGAAEAALAKAVDAAVATD